MEEIYDKAVVTAAEAILRQILLHLAQRAENELFAMCCVEYAAVIPAFSAEDILCRQDKGPAGHPEGAPDLPGKPA